MRVLSRTDVHVLDQCVEIRELQHALRAGLLTREGVHAELAAVVSGRRLGRTGDDEITVFDRSGTALQDVAAAVAVYEKALATGRAWRSTSMRDIVTGFLALVLLAVAALFVGLRFTTWSPALTTARAGTESGLVDVAAQFAVIGAFTFGGALSIIALIQDQVVHQLGWLSAQEFIEGLALGRLTPGPPIMVAAYVGYEALGLAGAAVAAIAIFLPSFVMMFALLPVFERVQAISILGIVRRRLAAAFGI